MNLFNYIKDLPTGEFNVEYPDGYKHTLYPEKYSINYGVDQPLDLPNFDIENINLGNNLLGKNSLFNLKNFNLNNTQEDGARTRKKK